MGSGKVGRSFGFKYYLDTGEAMGIDEGASTIRVKPEWAVVRCLQEGLVGIKPCRSPASRYFL